MYQLYTLLVVQRPTTRVKSQHLRACSCSLQEKKLRAMELLDPKMRRLTLIIP